MSMNVARRGAAYLRFLYKEKEIGMFMVQFILDFRI